MSNLARTLRNPALAFVASLLFSFALSHTSCFQEGIELIGAPAGGLIYFFGGLVYSTVLMVTPAGRCLRRAGSPCGWGRSSFSRARLSSLT